MPKKEILKKNLKALTESKTQQLRSINTLSRQIMNLKTELVTDPSNPLKNNDLKYLTDTVGKLLKTFDGIDDERIEDEIVEDDENVVADNEGSEAHGKMPEEAGLKAESVISISEETLKNVIKRVIQERTIKEQKTFDFSWEGIKNIPSFWVGKTKEVKTYLDGEKTPETAEEAKEAAAKLIKKLQAMFGL